ncbi:MAG: phospholipase D-like domain-containing protein [Bacteroidales bacterium]|nr:phospholipase D-like domain-containing protein [Bacteroidales bacterium]
MTNTLIDNSEHLKMVDTLKALIKDPACAEIKIATGYWDIPGLSLITSELRDFLSREGTRLKLLIGTDPIVRAYQLKNPTYAGATFPEDCIKRDVHDLEVKDEYKDSIALLLDHIQASEEDSKIRIRIYHEDKDGEEQFFHAKAYIFLGPESRGIIGSSNFTEKGLRGNSELNFLEASHMIVKFVPHDDEQYKGHNYWFEEKWALSQPWNQYFLEEVLRKAPIAKVVIEEQKPAPLTPYEVYIKYLQTQFGDMIDTNTSAILKTYLPQGYNPLDYQLDAVKQCYSIMKLHGGFLLGDVVGLGKTVVGILLIRYFLENAQRLGRAQKVLIVSPPAIKSGWIKTIQAFDQNSLNQIEPCVTFVTTGSVAKLTDIDDDTDIEDDEIEDLQANDYGLILIDESHGFRNSGTQKHKAIHELIGLINPTPFIGLLSATPQNNSPRDLYNQICLFQRNSNNSTLPGVEGGKLSSFFTSVEKRFNEARNMAQDTEEQRQEASQIIAEVSERIRRCVLNDLLVRRTRTDIKKFYATDAELLKFPEVKGPHKLEYHMDDELQKLFFDTTTAICPPSAGEQFDPEKHIGFYRYAAITQFVNREHTKLYEKRNLTVSSITQRLQRIMRILLVKRLESSMAAFKSTLSNLLYYTEVMIDMLEHDCVYICPDIDVNKLHRDNDGDFQRFAQTLDNFIAKKGGNNRRFHSTDFEDEYLVNLKNDQRLIKKLLNRWNANTYDPKFDRFKEAVKPELFAKDINNPSGKNKPRLVIFTEAIDTLESIARALNKDYRVLKVTSKNRDELQDTIEKNFDANCPADQQRDDYNVIVTTEVLAEGVNLHRANVVLNYDAPWNATRLMQRIGRVNRIGSVEDYVHVFNFFPSEEGNSQIRFIEKAYAKLQSFHEILGEDNKVFSEREELREHELQDLTDGDESPFGPYIIELKEYHKTHPERYQYIASLEPESLGGTVTATLGEKAVFVFTDSTQSYISVSIDHSAQKASIISSLSTMEGLKCAPKAQYLSTELGDNELAEIARRAYNTHVAHYITQQDSSKRITQALKHISEIRKQCSLSTESKVLLKQLEVRARNNDQFVIRNILKIDPANPSLFGWDSEINELLTKAFAHIGAQATAKRGEAKLAIFRIDKTADHGNEGTTA